MFFFGDVIVLFVFTQDLKMSLKKGLSVWVFGINFREVSVHGRPGWLATFRIKWIGLHGAIRYSGLQLAFKKQQPAGDLDIQLQM